MFSKKIVDTDQYEYIKNQWLFTNAENFEKKCNTLISAEIHGSLVHEKIMKSIAYAIESHEIDFDYILSEQEAVCFLSNHHDFDDAASSLFDEYICESADMSDIDEE